MGHESLMKTQIKENNNASGQFEAGNLFTLGF
jgi:hypothetical protein